MRREPSVVPYTMGLVAYQVTGISIGSVETG